MILSRKGTACRALCSSLPSQGHAYFMGPALTTGCRGDSKPCTDIVQGKALCRHSTALCRQLQYAPTAERFVIFYSLPSIFYSLTSVLCFLPSDSSLITPASWPPTPLYYCQSLGGQGRPPLRT